MAKVQSSRAKIYETKLTVADEPTQYVESAGDRLIKDLVNKQLDTQVDLQEQLRLSKEFQKSTEFVPLTNLKSGQSSLKEFENAARKASHIEDLKSFGLTNEEVEIAVDYEMGEDYFSEKYKKIENSVLTSRLLLINTKIKNGERQREEEISKRLAVGRHEHELSISIKPASMHTRLLQFALSCKAGATDPRPADHPIHHLKELEKELFGSLHKKPRKEKINLPSNLKKYSPPVSPCVSYNYEKNSTLWDVKDGPSLDANKIDSRKDMKSKCEVKVYTCKPETLYTIKDNKIIPLNSLPKHVPETKKESFGGEAFVLSDTNNSEISAISMDDIQSNKISVEEIRRLPRFNNYEQGCPSPILFVKNLAGSVKEPDLVSLFHHFELPQGQRIIYRLMTGRMKGQAFITFPDVTVATKALEIVNGYILKGKPMIIQYGKSASTG